jgi:hypothetical protein
VRKYEKERAGQGSDDGHSGPDLSPIRRRIEQTEMVPRHEFPPAGNYKRFTDARVIFIHD